MLKHLEIKNYALIESLSLDLDQGLTIITGETGAGKSILLGALGLIMGQRADSKVLYQEDQKCSVEAIFSIHEYNLQPLFKEIDIEYEDELIVRRVISASGKSRAFVNDEPTTLSVLKKLADNLIDLHQQFDTLDLHQASFQIKTLDAFAGNMDKVTQYQDLYQNYLKKKKHLNQLLEQKAGVEREMDFLSFQMKEFNDAELMPGEQEEKEQLLEKLNKSEDIVRVAQLANHLILEGEQTIEDSLTTIANELDHIRSADPNLDSAYQRMNDVLEELRDICRSCSRVADQVEYDEALITELNERLSLIYKLQKKHQVQSLEDLLEVQDTIAEKLNSFGDLSGEINALEKDIDQLEKKLIDNSKVIRKARIESGPKFEEAIHNMLVPLSMEHAYIKVDIQPLQNPGPTGMDEVTFLFSPNKGSSFKPLKDIASGGEISRLTLCIKSLIADVLTLPTLIFDEIDTGVSGEVAARMGDLLNRLSNKHQVITITHSPQIASNADVHLFVHKEEKADRTVTGIKVLDPENRVIEIAKMLSGNPPSQAALANAKELLAG